jgi:phosphoinositide-3-kinase regulatory subunit 4
LLAAERDALSDLHSVNTYQAFVETEKAGYLIRQWIGSNLYDRVRWVLSELGRESC